MPKFTLAFWENRVRQDLAGEDRSSIKKIAKLAKRRFEVFTNEPSDDEMLEFYSTITYADPTPYLAIRHINSENAARRLGVA
jgi:hypothetical protein